METNRVLTEPELTTIKNWWWEKTLEEKFYTLIEHNRVISGDRTRHPNSLNEKEIVILYMAAVDKFSCVSCVFAKHDFGLNGGFSCEKNKFEKHLLFSYIVSETRCNEYVKYKGEIKC